MNFEIIRTGKITITKSARHRIDWCDSLGAWDCPKKASYQITGNIIGSEESNVYMLCAQHYKEFLKLEKEGKEL